MHVDPVAHLVGPVQPWPPHWPYTGAVPPVGAGPDVVVVLVEVGAGLVVDGGGGLPPPPLFLARGEICGTPGK